MAVPMLNGIKFASDIAEYLYTLQGDKTIGLPEDIGWHGLYAGDLIDGEGFDQLSAPDQEKLRSSAAAILMEDEHHFVDAEFFDDEHEAMRVWEDIEDSYYDFYDKRTQTASKTALYTDIKIPLEESRKSMEKQKEQDKAFDTKIQNTIKHQNEEFDKLRRG